MAGTFRWSVNLERRSDPAMRAVDQQSTNPTQAERLCLFDHV
jgi:hypothetical protein